MININNNIEVDVNRLGKLLNKYGSNCLKINEQLILDDIEKLREEIKVTKSKVRIRNIEVTIYYLKNILRNLRQGELNLKWQVNKDGEIETSPIKLIDMEMFNIVATDYVEINNRAINVDYSEVMRLIAFEQSHEDLGINSEKVEEHLKDLGIIAAYESDKIMSIVPEYALEQARVTSIKNSPYIDKENKIIYNYFVGGRNAEISKFSKYKTILEASNKYAISLIVQSILSHLEEEKQYVELISVQDCNIQFIMEDNHEYCQDKILNILNEQVFILIAGRKFKVKPKVTVY